MVKYDLYVITDSKLSRGRSHEEVARQAIAGGASIIQLRDKEASTRELVEVGARLRALTREAGVTYIVNDRLDVALAVEADGVHLGQDDMPARLARRLLGQGKILGLSATNLQEALQAEGDGASYLGVGPIFPTATKPDAAPAMGLEALAEVVRRVSIPVVAIGGITGDNAERVVSTGVDGVAVVSAVVSAPDIQAAARELLLKILAAKARRG